MAVVTELFDSYAVEETVVEIRRNQELLFTKSALGQRLPSFREHKPLQVTHFPLKVTPKKFSPPVGIYESEHMRMEWQLMDNFRQPFYHRNLDVDELSYQICGERTLMTEVGTHQFQLGDFSRIPVGVAHDNFGTNDIHLLFYIPAPVRECLPSTPGTLQIPSFEGWAARPTGIPEATTTCLGGPGCDASLYMGDETLLLHQVERARDPDRIQITRPEQVAGRQWLYKSKHVWLGFRRSVKGERGDYLRHRCGDEIQCQVKGKRTLISQYGQVELEEGDFVNIPAGVTFTDISHEDNEHIIVLTQFPVPAKSDVVKIATPVDLSLLA